MDIPFYEDDEAFAKRLQAEEEMVAREPIKVYPHRSRSGRSTTRTILEPSSDDDDNPNNQRKRKQDQDQDFIVAVAGNGDEGVPCSNLSLRQGDGDAFPSPCANKKAKMPGKSKASGKTSCKASGQAASKAVPRHEKKHKSGGAVASNKPKQPGVKTPRASAPAAFARSDPTATAPLPPTALPKPFSTAMSLPVQTPTPQESQHVSSPDAAALQNQPEGITSSPTTTAPEQQTNNMCHAQEEAPRQQPGSVGPGHTATQSPLGYNTSMSAVGKVAAGKASGKKSGKGVRSEAGVPSASDKITKASGKAANVRASGKASGKGMTGNKDIAQCAGSGRVLGGVDAAQPVLELPTFSMMPTLMVPCTERPAEERVATTALPIPLNNTLMPSPDTCGAIAITSKDAATAMKPATPARTGGFRPVLPRYNAQGPAIGRTANKAAGMGPKGASTCKKASGGNTVAVAAQGSGGAASGGGGASSGVPASGSAPSAGMFAAGHAYRPQKKGFVPPRMTRRG